MILKVYTINELESLIKEPGYFQNENIPLSPLRAVSYINNPRAEKSMPVLFTFEENGKIIAYRTLLPDYFLNAEKRVKFAWLSGNYVSPDYRRNGLSTKLLNEVENSWKGKLMFTNYAPASKAVYDKTGRYSLFQSNPGKRYYLRSALHLLLKDRLPSGGILKLIDKTINTFHNPAISNYQLGLHDGVSVHSIEEFDDEIAGIIQNQTKNSLFKRGTEEFQWIINNPWVTDSSEGNTGSNYNFTWIVDDFQNRWFKLQKGTDLGFLWITMVNEKFSVPYYFSNNRSIDIAARQVIFREMIEHNAAYVTTRNPDIGPMLGIKKNPFLYARHMPQHYFAHQSLHEQIPVSKRIYDGDGDCVFT